VATGSANGREQTRQNRDQLGRTSQPVTDFQSALADDRLLDAQLLTRFPHLIIRKLDNQIIDIGHSFRQIIMPSSISIAFLL
jgi:hypothetical protein